MYLLIEEAGVLGENNRPFVGKLSILVNIYKNDSGRLYSLIQGLLLNNNEFPRFEIVLNIPDN